MLNSLIRTLVPLLVAWLARYLPGVDESQLTEAVTLVVAGSYYIVVRVLEHHVSARFGLLLGTAAEPSYD